MQHHLAVVYRTYVDDVLAGRKTIECRFGRMGYLPDGAIQAGDLIWLKEVSGPIRAVAGARSIRRFSPLTRGRIEAIRREWNDQIRAPRAFWQAARRATVATLIWLDPVCALEPFRIAKRDRRAWVLLDGPPVPGGPLARHPVPD
jgi:hypothetical protein